MRSLHRALHTDRVVVVQPRSYGSDDSRLLDALKQLGPSARGIAVINEKTTEEDLSIRCTEAGYEVFGLLWWRLV
jgi:hypothetical protein